MKVLHVGMGKTATSSLQVIVFPRLAKSGFLDAYNPRDLHLGLDATLNGFGPEEGLAALADEQERMLISNETLLEWDPALWEESADLLLRVFGQDVTILITMREPKSYLRSLYQQALHAGKVRLPEEFFLPAAEYRAARRFIRPGELDAIDVDAFDMARMVSLYADRFASVVLVPFEEIGQLRFLTAIWGITESERLTLCRAFATSPRVNTSYSRLAMRLTLGRERLLAGLGMRSLSSSDRQLRRALAYARGTLFSPRSSVFPTWDKLMRLLSQLGPKKRYSLPDGLYLGQHLADNTAFYNAVRRAPNGHARFRDGVVEGCNLEFRVDTGKGRFKGNTRRCL